jgi:hypothetical protein
VSSVLDAVVENTEIISKQALTVKVQDRALTLLRLDSSTGERANAAAIRHPGETNP